MTTLHRDLTQVHLHDAFGYVQNSDPGAVGAGAYWLDVTAPPFPLWRRNNADTGWDAVGGSGSSTFSGCQGFASSNQTIADTNLTFVPFDTNFFDTDSYLDPGGNPTRMTVPVGKAGYFVIGANILWDDNALGIREINLIKNNSDDIARVTASPSATGFEQNVSIPVQLADGDFIELQVFQTSGGGLDIVSAAFHSITAWMTRMGS